ncbi:MAG: CarD family transcriptional regulator [Clostridia bacterium]|nr:CarD family transcriptional regulator [Clostridia bacterium]
MRFAIGDLIIYNEIGVCRVDDIIEKEFPDGVKKCYKLQPIYQSCAIFTPVDNETVFMRHIISREEADKLINDVCDIKPAEITSASPRELSNEYESIIKLHDCAELVALTKHIYTKRARLVSVKKKLPAVDERYVKKAEDLLFGELAAALGIDKSSVRENIAEKVGANK